MRLVGSLGFVASVGYAVAGVLGYLDFWQFVFLEILTLILAGVYVAIESYPGDTQARK